MPGFLGSRHFCSPFTSIHQKQIHLYLSIGKAVSLYMFLFTLMIFLSPAIVRRKSSALFPHLAARTSSKGLFLSQRKYISDLLQNLVCLIPSPSTPLYLPPPNSPLKVARLCLIRVSTVRLLVLFNITHSARHFLCCQQGRSIHAFSHRGTLANRQAYSPISSAYLHIWSFYPTTFPNTSPSIFWCWLGWLHGWS